MQKLGKIQSLKKKLLNNPAEALKEMGIDVNKEVKIHIVEEDKNTVTFILHKAPQNVSSMDEEELKRIAGGLSGETPYTTPACHK